MALNEEIESLKLKLTECEKQNELLRGDTVTLGKRCAELVGAEQASALELNGLKARMQQMCDQYAELDKKFGETSARLKLYEQR